MEEWRPRDRSRLRRKLRNLIDHPSTEPVVRSEAQRKYALLFANDDPEELPPDIKAFLIVERHLYPFPERFWPLPFIRVGAGFQPRSVSYGDILRAAAGAEFVGFYQIGRAILVEYDKVISHETLVARFAGDGLDCTVRHVDGFSGRCHYQLYFREAETALRRWVR